LQFFKIRDEIRKIDTLLGGLGSTPAPRDTRICQDKPEAMRDVV